jgi:ABC-type glycerol-3-phosphate transport system permease component
VRTARAAPKPNRWARQWPQIVLHAALIALLLLTLYPVLNMLSLSFKNPLQWTNDRWALTFPLRVQNYGIAWNLIKGYLLNTVFVASVGGAAMLFLSSLSAFIFARMRFPGREVLYYAIIALLMVPAILSLVPAFMLYKNLGLLNSYWTMIVAVAAGSSPYGVFLLRTFFASIPEELFEAARVDGCTTMQLYWRICIPLSYPILGTLAIQSLVSTWNSFIWPSVAIQDNRVQVISVGLLRLTESLTTATGGDAAAYGPLFAGYVIASLPLFLIFVFASRYYIEGLTSSGMKL